MPQSALSDRLAINHEGSALRNLQQWPNLDILRMEEDQGMDGDSGMDGDDGINWDEWRASDDVKGGELPPELVRQARLKELAYLKNRCVYAYASTAAAIKAVGRRPLSA